MLKGSELIYKKLLQNNVKDVFLYSGGAVMSLIDTFYQNKKINYYINSNEHNGCNSAIGYAKSSGQTGVMITTSGPGLTNCVTSMLDSQNDSTPLVVLSGQVPKQVMGTQAFQECPATEITRPFTKWSHVVDNPNDLGYCLDKAFYIANNKKKGCVHLDIPKCVLSSDVTHEKHFLPEERNKKTKKLIGHQELDEIIQIIGKAERPIFFLGKGCNHYPALIRNLIRYLNIPCTTTLHGMGIIPEDNFLNLEMCGMHGSYVSNMALHHSDCIINLGARFDDRTTGNPEKYGEFAEHIIHINIEKSEINKNIKASHSFECDVEDFVIQLMQHPNYTFITSKFAHRLEWFSHIKKWKVMQPFKYNKELKLATPDVLKCIDKFKFNSDIITFGVGNHLMMGCQYITWKEPNKVIASGSLGVMGCSIGYAIGSQIANPHLRVISIDGDGSFNMTLNDLQTIRRYNLPIKIAIINDGSLSMVKIWEKLFFEERYTATDNPSNPDYVQLAESYGIKGMMCDNKKDLPNKVRTFMDYDNGPILCEFRTQGEECFPLVAPGKALNEMILYGETQNDFGKIDPPN